MLTCRWCPDTLAVWSRFLDTFICPDCKGDDFTEEEESDD